MKNILRAFIFIITVSALANAQNTAYRVYTRTSLPTTCSKTTSSTDMVVIYGANDVYICKDPNATYPDNWQFVGGGSSSTGGVTNSAGSNIVTKSDSGGNLVASNITDDNTDIKVSNIIGKTILGDTSETLKPYISLRPVAEAIYLSALNNVGIGDINGVGNTTYLAIGDASKSIYGQTIGSVDFGDPDGSANGTNLNISVITQTITNKAANGNIFLASNSATVSDANTTKLRYDSSTQSTQFSENGGAYDDVIFKTKTQTLTNKTISGANNTLTIREPDFSFTDITTNNSSTSKHGLLPKLSGNATDFLKGDGSWGVPSGGTTINATNNVIPKRLSATAFTNSLLTDDGTSVTNSGNDIVASDNFYAWSGRSKVKSAVNGSVTLWNTAETGFNCLNWGHTEGSPGWPKVCRNGSTALELYGVAGIYDKNANESILITTTTSAVNEFTVVNAATGNAPAITATGGDTNIDIALTPKGTGGVVINSGTAIKKVLSASATLDFGSTLAQTDSDLTITVTGAADGDVCSVGVPNGSTQTGSSFSCWVSASNTVTVRFSVYGVTAKDPASGTFRVMVTKF